jgi:hypothetical protein
LARTKIVNPILKKITRMAKRNAVIDHGPDSEQVRNHSLLLQRMKTGIRGSCYNKLHLISQFVRRRTVGRQDFRNCETDQERVGVQEKRSCERERGKS